MESVVHMYIFQHGNMQTYFNMNDSHPDQLQHKMYEFGTWSQTAP